ncbi:MAG TPA: CsiV family protein [Pseudomonadales bacterium]
MKLAYRLIAPLLATLVSHTVLAIDDGDIEDASPNNTLYRVELLVFANSNPADEASEQWFPPRTLPVPERLQVLLPAWTAEPAMTEAAAPMATPPSTAPADDPPFTEMAITSADLLQAADRIRRSRYYRLLTMTAWEQPMLRDEKPVAIVIRGGEVFGQHHELEGTLSLRRERYLHAHVQLWLSRFSDYTGELQDEDWPALPLLPKPPARMTPADVDTESALDLAADTAQTEADTALSSEMTASDAASESLEENLALDEWAEYDWFTPARPDRIVLMDQTRRLRSNELHYIDHPLLGVILRISPAETTNQP